MVAHAIWRNKCNDDTELQDVRPSIEKSPEQNALPLSTENLFRKQEEEDQRLAATVDDSYLLSVYDVRDLAFRDRMHTWVEQDLDAGGEEEEHVNDRHRDELSYARGINLTPSEKSSWVDYQHTETAKTDPDLAERSSRISAAKQRIYLLNSRRNIRNRKGIKPEMQLYLRYAMHSDAKGLMEMYNSYIPTSPHCLETQKVTATEMYNRINQSQNNELPFIVAMKPEENPGPRKPHETLIGFVRLTNFMDGQPSVTSTAQLEILVGHHHKGQNVGRCLMDAILTIADPGYAPRGGYVFECKSLNGSPIMENYASISCRPLTHVVTMMNHTTSEVGRYQRVKQWLEKEFKFSEKGNLPSVARKMDQP